MRYEDFKIDDIRLEFPRDAYQPAIRTLQKKSFFKPREASKKNSWSIGKDKVYI